MARYKTDELNIFNREYPAIDYEEYFSIMDIPEEDKEKRVELANKIDDIFFGLFAMVAMMYMLDEPIDKYYLMDYVETRLNEVMEPYNYDYFTDYARKASEDVIDTTLRHQDEDYFLSDERASRLAAEEAQTIANYSELQEAKKEGYTHKTWVTELDRKTRESHREMNGKTIEIDKYFQFDDCEMLCPHDEINGTARQNANCRCSLKYGNKEKPDEPEPQAESRVDNKRYKDVTEEYFRTATPNSHEIVIDKEYTDPQGNTYRYIEGSKNVRLNNKGNELRVAKLLEKLLGGEIHLVPEINIPEGIKTADYIFRGLKYDLKTISKSGENVIYGRLSTAKGQASRFVVDITNNSLKRDNLIKQAEDLFYRDKSLFINEVILVDGDDIIKILQKR